jgi:site-specific recombinase XerD
MAQKWHKSPMAIKKRGKNYYLHANEGKFPYTRLRQSLGQIPELLAWKIAAALQDAYWSKEVDPFQEGFNILNWYFSGVAQQAVSVREAAEQFLQDKEGVTSVETIKTYAHYIRFWMDFAKVHDLPVSHIEPKHIKGVLLREGTSSKSKDSFKRHLSAFFQYCIRQKWTKENPVKAIILPKVRESKVKKMPHNSEIDLIYNAFESWKESQQGNKNKRDRWEMHWFKPIIALMRYAGLRRQEAVTRKWSDYSDGKIYVEPLKGVRERFVPVVPVLADLLEELRARNMNGSPWMFANPIQPEKHITGERVYKAFKEVCKYAGVDSARTLHGLRHAFVTDLLEKGLSTAEVKLLSGHSTVQVTEGYAHLVVDHLKEKMV